MLKRFKHSQLFWLELSLTSLNLPDVPWGQLLDTPCLVGEAFISSKNYVQCFLADQSNQWGFDWSSHCFFKATLFFFKNIYTLILCKFILIEGYKLSLHNINPYYKSIESVIQK